jgi:hypothetical protein
MAFRVTSAAEADDPYDFLTILTASRPVNSRRLAVYFSRQERPQECSTAHLSVLKVRVVSCQGLKAESLPV